MTPLGPRATHAADQLGAALREIARIVGEYRAELRERGVPDDEAWALTQRLEERLLGRMLPDARADWPAPSWRALADKHRADRALARRICADGETLARTEAVQAVLGRSAT